MFKRLRKWFNDPINKNDFFGNNLKEVYQLFRDFKKNNAKVKEETAGEFSPSIQMIVATPIQFVDNSLISLKMEIRSKVIFLAANKHLYTNADIYIERYENLIKCIDSLISITELTEEESKKVISDSFKKPLEVSIPIQPVHPIENEVDIKSSVLDACKRVHEMVEEVVTAPEGTRLMDPNFGGPIIPPSVSIPPQINTPHDYIPIENMIENRIAYNEHEEEKIETIDHSHDTLGARDITNVKDEDEETIQTNDHSCDTLGARDITKVTSENNSSFDKEVVFKQVCDVIREVLGFLPTKEIRMRSNFQYDLGTDDLDMVEIAMAAEEKFKIVIDDEVEKMKTVEDIVNYLVSKTKS